LVFRNERNNFSGSSVCGKITTDQTIGVEYYKGTPDVDVFPNPTNGYLTVEGSGINKIVVLNMSGQVVKTMQPSGNKTQVDLSDLKKGIYLLRAILDNNSMMGKIVLE